MHKAELRHSFAIQRKSEALFRAWVLEHSLIGETQVVTTSGSLPATAHALQ